MIPPLHATKPDLKEKENRRRRLIAELVPLEAELLAAGVISRRVVMARSVVHGERLATSFDERRYVVDFASLDGRGDLE